MREIGKKFALMKLIGCGWYRGKGGSPGPILFDSLTVVSKINIKHYTYIFSKFL